MDQDATWHGGRPLPWPHRVRWGPSYPKRGRAPQLSVHVYCGQTAERSGVPLGTEVGFGPGDIVLHGDSAPLLQKGTPSTFRPMSVVAKPERIKMPLRMEVGLSPGDFAFDGDPAPPQKGGGALANFRPMSIAAKRLHGSRYHLVQR